MHNLDDIRRSPYSNKDNCILDDATLATEELARFAQFGGGTIVDVTPADIGRNVRGLAEVAKRTGVNVVASCGYYIESAQSETLKAMTQDQVTEALLAEINNGIDGTEILPGIIGEIGTSHPIDPAEEKVLRAAAAAHTESGLPITIHVHPPGRRGHDVLDILEREGVRLNRVVLGHADAALAHADIDLPRAIQHHRSLADRGAYIEYDLCGNSGYFKTDTHSWWLPSDRERVSAIDTLIHAGHGGQILLAQDIGHKHYLRRYGGWGYAHVLDAFTDYLRESGVTDGQIDRILVTNPRTMLTPGT